MLIAAGIRPEIRSGIGLGCPPGQRPVPFTVAVGLWLFLIGFWGAVFSSVLGVWHGVPYLFTNFVAHWRSKRTVLESDVSITRSLLYRGFLCAMCFLPMLLLIFGRPVWIVQLYA